ncbi:MAG: xanthine dehydrogenase family protein subunit M [Chloroflexi bacterium]|nr:MAG: xanthine dehydrogenase family protein subunit M [Chloroflexota bacterium]
MKPAPFRYVRAGSVAEAVAELAAAGGDAKPLAGGQSLVPLMNLRLARPAVLVDLNPIAELERLEVEDGRLVIGALVRHRRLATDPLVAAHAPLLAEAARWIGHGAIRARGTIGGSLAHADPAAELPCAAVALGAELSVAGPGGARTLAAAALVDGAYSTRLAEDEMITAVRVPITAGPVGWGFAEIARRHGDFALVLAAATAVPGRAVVTLGGVASAPLRIDGELDPQQREEAIAGLAARCVELCEPAGDVHATADWRRAMVGVVATRALRDALRC